MSFKTQGGTRPPGALALGRGCAARLLDSAFGEGMASPSEKSIHLVRLAFPCR
jgi:hypothetical protein